MRRVLIAAGVFAVVAGGLTAVVDPAQAAPSPAPLLQMADATGDDSYVVVLKNGTTDDAVKRATAAGATVQRRFSHVLNGYQATLTSSELSAVRADPAVKYVVPNGAVEKSGSEVKGPANWGLDRIDQRTLPLNGRYYVNAKAGRDGVRAFIVDTGIDVSSGRLSVARGVDTIGTSDGRVDCNGHGTHVASIVNSPLGYGYGVTDSFVSLVPVRVLGCDGRGSVATVLAGLDWIAQQPVIGPQVVNLALIKTNSPAINDSVQALLDQGITVVASSGDHKTTGGVNACFESPAQVTFAITVGVSTRSDEVADYSNWGGCVDLFAPGDRITALGLGKSVATYSGSSQAAAFVTGAAALYLLRHQSATPTEVHNWIRDNATTGVLSNLRGSPDRLLFALEAQDPPQPRVTGGDRITEREVLVKGTRLYSANQAYFLAFRSKDSWLCLYNASSGKVVWCNGHGGLWTRFTFNHITTYDQYQRKTWASPSSFAIAPPAELIVNGKGYLMVKDGTGMVRWRTP